MMYLQSCVRAEGIPVEILDLKKFKEMVVSWYALTFCEEYVKLLFN